jgi:hypothetical protein
MTDFAQPGIEEERVSGAWTTKRTLKERKQQATKEKKERKLLHSDLMWAAKRRYLTEEEWIRLHYLDREFGKWGPERAEFEFKQMEMLREHFKAFDSKAEDSFLSVLDAHVARQGQIARNLEKQNQKPIVSF